MNESKKKTRRRYDAELKQQILAQCTEPGASVASTGRHNLVGCAKATMTASNLG